MAYEDLQTAIKKSPETLKMERAAEELERKIVRFTNIDKESFTHSFRGISITVKAGESMILRFPEADHLATHLVRKIISREKKKANRPDKTYHLWDEAEIKSYKEKILEMVDNESASPITREEARKKDMERLQEQYQKPQKPFKEPDKKDIIRDLEARGLKPDASKSKEELLEFLMDAESKGISPKYE